MLFRRVVPFMILSLATFVACGGDETTDATTPTTTNPDGGAGNGTGPGTGPGTGSSPPGTPEAFPAAVGDPCRGTPLSASAYAPAGLCARLVANANVSGLRQITFAPNGDLLGAAAGGKIMLFRDADKDGVYAKSEVTVWGDTGGNGNNAFIDATGGHVYASSPAGVKRFAWDPAAPTGGPAEDVVVNQPGGGHSKHTAKVYDGFLYVQSGSSSNQSFDDQVAGEYDRKRSLIRRFDLSKFVAGTPFDWSKDGENVSMGLRNPNGFTRNETTKKIYAVVNGLDGLAYKGADIHENNPGEQVVHVLLGKNYGYPFCFTAQRVVAPDVIAPGTQLTAVFAGAPANDDAWCAKNSTPPVTFMQAHSAPLDIAFFDRQPVGGLPETYRGGAFVALHGSWNRSAPTGYKVVWQPFAADGTSTLPTSTKDTTTFPHEIVFGGADDKGAAKDGSWQWSSPAAGDTPRPSGVAVSPVDGALYIATDSPGALYRVGLTR